MKNLTVILYLRLNFLEKFRNFGHVFFLWIMLIAGVFLNLANPVLAQDGSGGDAISGKKIFKKCMACHKIGPDAKNATGPVLNNVFGRLAGSFEGYRYGKGMKAANAKGLVWDTEKLDGYLTNPKKYLRAYLGDKKAKAKMKFKLKMPNERADVIAFLMTISNAARESMNTDTKKMNEAKSTNGAMATPHMAATGELCVQNGFDKELLFTVERKDETRKAKTISMGEVLCLETTGEDIGGTVGVFENEDALEGCSRLAKAGATEILMAYASFDNCTWK